jgi:hypothetical protein
MFAMNLYVPQALKGRELYHSGKPAAIVAWFVVERASGVSAVRFRSRHTGMQLFFVFVCFLLLLCVLPLFVAVACFVVECASGVSAVRLRSRDTGM